MAVKSDSNQNGAVSVSSTDVASSSTVATDSVPQAEVQWITTGLTEREKNYLYLIQPSLADDNAATTAAVAPTPPSSTPPVPPIGYFAISHQRLPIFSLHQNACGKTTASGWSAASVAAIADQLEIGWFSIHIVAWCSGNRRPVFASSHTRCFCRTGHEKIVHQA